MKKRREIYYVGDTFYGIIKSRPCTPGCVFFFLSCRHRHRCWTLSCALFSFKGERNGNEAAAIVATVAAIHLHSLL